MRDAATEPPTDVVAGYPHGQVPRAIREEQLLQLALALFLEHGYTGVSIGELAARAGVSRPIVYQHFGSKEGLYLACTRRIRDELDAALVRLTDGGSDVDTLVREGSTAWFRLVERDPTRWLLVYGGASTHVGGLADGLAQQREGTIGLIAGMFRPHLPGVDPQDLLLLANAISGAGEQLARYWLRHRDLPLDRMVEAQVAACLPAVHALQASSTAQGHARP